MWPERPSIAPEGSAEQQIGASAGEQSFTAEGINDNGDIVGTAVGNSQAFTNQTVGYELTPVSGS